MAQIYKKGDIVILKSGDPQMTVEKYKLENYDMDTKIESDHIVICTWFDKDYKLKRHEFEQEALMKYDE